MSTPEPLTPPDCDLRGLEYMPLLGNHLFGSDFNARASDTEFRVALTLWWAAWTQHPAASLPDNDEALCRLADLGRDMRTWRKVKAVALHGFVKCSDGRLYHSVLAKQAVVAWEKRVNDRKRKAEWRARREQERSSQHGAETPENSDINQHCHADATVTGCGPDAEKPLNRRDGTGRDGTISQAKPSLESKPEPSRARTHEAPPRSADCLNEVCTAAGWHPRTDEQRIEALSVVDGWLAAGFDFQSDILAGIGRAVAKQPSKTSSLKRFTTTIRGIHYDRRGGAQRINGHAHHPPAGEAADIAAGVRSLVTTLGAKMGVGDQ